MKIGLYLLVVVIWISGCGSVPEKPQEVSEQNLSVNETVPQFCNDLAEKISSREQGVIVSRFDKARFVKNTLSLVSLNPQEKHAASVFLDSMITNVVDTVENSLFYRGSWHVQSMRDEGGRGRCILQSGISESGVSIIEFYLINDDAIMISNWFDHMQGALASDRIRIMLTDLYRYSNRASESDEAKSEFQSIVNFNKAISEQNIDSAFDTYALLPEAMKKNGISALNLAMLSITVGQRYEEATEILLHETGYSGDPLLVIDYFVAKQKYAEAHAILNAVENKIGQSSVLEIIRSSIYSEQGQAEKSWKHALLSIDVDKGYEGAYWHVFSQFVEQEMYADAVLVLDILYKAWGYDFSREMFVDEIVYKDLVHAPSFNKWIEGR